ncbi:MAG: alpha/beta hydrolase [Candidatus Sericytochromatia bacterium]
MKHIRLLAAASLVGLSAMTAVQAQTPKPDAQMQAVLTTLGGLGGKPIEYLTPAQARQQPTPADAVKKLLEKQGKPTDPEAVGSVTNRIIPGPGGALPIRIYKPAGQGPFPVVVYYHGGGWVIATNDTYDASARALTRAAQAAVVAVEYRKAPEHKFPAAHNDAFAAYQWVLANASSFSGDSQRVAVAGESAGGNLAANVSLMARDKGIRKPLHQVLVYPVADNNMNAVSYQQNAKAKPLNKAMMGWFMQHALSSPAQSADPRLSLVDASLRGLPATTLITAEIDPLRTEGMLLGEKLKAAGVPVDARLYTGVAHEFFGMGAVVDKAKEAVNQAGANLKAAFKQ